MPYKSSFSCSLRAPLLTDIGAGTGLLSLMAARAGAPRVLAVEMAEELAQIARQVVTINGYNSSVKVLTCHSSQLNPSSEAVSQESNLQVDGEWASSSASSGIHQHQALPDKASDLQESWRRRADMLVFEILGTDPFSEGLLPTLLDARERLLTPDAAIIPAALEVHAAVVQSAELASMNSVGSVGGFDLRALNSLSHRTRAVRLSDLEHKLLTRPTVVLKMELDNAEVWPVLSGDTVVDATAEHSGIGHAVVAWFTVQLDRTAVATKIGTAPGEGGPMRGYAWGQCAHFLQPGGLAISAGSQLLLRTRWTDKGISIALDVVKAGAVAKEMIARNLLAGGFDVAQMAQKKISLAVLRGEAPKAVQTTDGELKKTGPQPSSKTQDYDLSSAGEWKTELKDKMTYEEQMRFAEEQRQIEAKARQEARKQLDEELGLRPSAPNRKRSSNAGNGRPRRHL